MAIVQLDNLTRRFAGSAEPAVANLSLTIGDGEFMVLLGPSGCGKSTTLRMIAGLEPISSGKLLIDGVVINDLPAMDRDIAMVFQSYALYPHMSVYNNMAFGLRRRGIAREEIDRSVREVAQTLGLTPLLARKPHALSGGQRQRVALGRAIVRNPKVFLFDEPLSNLDAALRVSMRSELLKQHHRLRATMIYVTHDQIEAMTMGDRICIINDGRAVQIGAPLEVYRNPVNTFVARFLGSPPMNLISAGLVAGDAGTVALMGSQQIRMPGHLSVAASGWIGRPVILGVRPENLYETPPEQTGRYAQLSASVIAVEPLGAETLLILGLNGESDELIARVGADSMAKRGQTTTVFLDCEALHLFDPVSTEAIG